MVLELRAAAVIRRSAFLVLAADVLGVFCTVWMYATGLIAITVAPAVGMILGPLALVGAVLAVVALLRAPPLRSRRNIALVSVGILGALVLAWYLRPFITS